MRGAALVIVFILIAWAANGEMKARQLDDAFGITTTGCLRSGGTAENPMLVSNLYTTIAGHELLYMRIRNFLVKRCSRPF